MNKGWLEYMREIKFLSKGDKISLVAPSFGCVIEPYKTRLEIAIKNMEKDGYVIEKGDNIYLAKCKTRSNSPRQCALEFNKAYLESDSKVVWSVGGGETMCEILPFIDFKRIKKAPFKWFIGFSDNTNLTYTLTTHFDMPTIYGSNFPAFAYKPYEYCEKDVLDLVSGKTKSTCGYPTWERYKDEELAKEPLAPKNVSEAKILKLFPNKDVEIQGRLLGGCLDCILNLCGTKYDKTLEYIERHKKEGIIFFLEACDLNPLSLERGLYQLREASYFKYCKGFIIGRPLCYKQRLFGVNHYNAIKEILGKLHLPIIMDADLGHFYPSMPIVNGALAKVKTENNNIYIDYLDL